MSVLLIASSEMNVKLYSGFNSKKETTGSKVGTDRLNENESLKKFHDHSLMGKPTNTTELYLYVTFSFLASCRI